MKAYEADMRHLLDCYIQADDSVVISPFGELSLIEIIVKSGVTDAINDKLSGIKDSKEVVAETIENNVRRKIIKDHPLDPAYFEKMSKLLDELIKFRKENAKKYEEYLKRIAELASKVSTGQTDNTPEQLNSPGKRALFNNLSSARPNDETDENTTPYSNRVDVILTQALNIDKMVKKVRSDGWRGNQAKENLIKDGIWEIMKDTDEVERIFAIVKQQNEY